MGDSRDFLKFPDLMPVDHARHCHLYANVVNRTDGSIAVDEIDDIQMDLETLLIAAAGRMRKLQSEINVLSDVGETKKDKKKDVDSKRGKSQEERPLKKLKTSDSPAHVKHPLAGSSGSSVGKPKAKSTPVKMAEPNHEEERLQLFQPLNPPVQEAPNKFWQSVEPYCQPIQLETIIMLEQMYQAQQDNEEYFKIPELGVPFSQRWTVEDMREEQREGSRANVKKGDKNDDSVRNIMAKAADSVKVSESTPFGSLTQRLISAFVDENIMLPPDSASTIIETASPMETSSLKTDGSGVPKIPKPLSAVHANKLENRIKMELIEQGILEPDCDEIENEDEILNELMSCQQELKAVSSQNRELLLQLINVAKDEMKKQEIRKKVELVNADVMEQYRKVNAVRQKKRTLMKKEKDAAWKALRERDYLIKQLE